MAIVVAANLLLLPGMYGASLLSGAPFLPMLRGEGNAATWFSSLQLLFIGLAAFGNREALRAHDDCGSRRPWLWSLLAIGFVALAVDERFAVHEWIRDTWLTVDDGAKPADVVLLAYAAGGLVFAAFLVGELRHSRAALWLLGAAVAVAAASVLVDGLPKDFKRPARIAWSVAEEMSELTAQMFFALAFLVSLRDRLRSPG